MNDLAGEADAEVLEATGDKLPKQIYHSIVCVAALVAHRDQGAYVVDALGAPRQAKTTQRTFESTNAEILLYPQQREASSN